MSGMKSRYRSILGVMVGYSVLIPYTFGLFVKPLSTPSVGGETKSIAFGSVAVTVAACSPVVGRLREQFGPRRRKFSFLRLGNGASPKQKFAHVRISQCCHDWLRRPEGNIERESLAGHQKRQETAQVGWRVAVGLRRAPCQTGSDGVEQKERAEFSQKS